MTKDGRPSRINDIRLFVGHDRLRRGNNPYLKSHEEAVAFARRVAFLLNGEGLSLGAYTALYILFTPLLAAGAAEVTDHGGDWWQRYTDVGVPPDFPNIPGADEIAMRGIVAALQAIRPDQADLITNAGEVVPKHGQDVRFLLKRRETRDTVVDLSFSVGAWPSPSRLFVSATDKATGEYSDIELASLQLYDQAIDLAGQIKGGDGSITVEPRTSVKAQMSADQYGFPRTIAAAEFMRRASRPIVSKPLKLGG